MTKITAQTVSKTIIYKDGVLVEKRTHQSTGKVKKVEVLNQKNEIESTISIEDTIVSYIYFKNNQITSSIKYVSDILGNTKSILNYNSKDSLTSFMNYELNYHDTLLIKKSCKSGCNYIENYLYNNENLLIKTERIYSNNKDWNTFSTWKYDDKKRVIEFLVETINSPRSDQKYKTEYLDNIEITENYVKSDDKWNLVEKVSLYFENKQIARKVVEFFEMDEIYKTEWTYVYEKQ